MLFSNTYGNAYGIGVWTVVYELGSISVDGGTALDAIRKLAKEHKSYTDQVVVPASEDMIQILPVVPESCADWIIDTVAPADDPIGMAHAAPIVSDDDATFRDIVLTVNVGRAAVGEEWVYGTGSTGNYTLNPYAVQRIGKILEQSKPGEEIGGMEALSVEGFGEDVMRVKVHVWFYKVKPDAQRIGWVVAAKVHEDGDEY